MNQPEPALATTARRALKAAALLVIGCALLGAGLTTWAAVHLTKPRKDQA